MFAAPLPGIETHQQLLVTLLVKVGVVASLASILVRSGTFKSALFHDERTLAQRVHLGMLVGVTFALGVGVRILLRYKAPDLGLEAALLAGVLGGHVAGGVAGVLVALPALMNGEIAALPFFLAVGLAGGLARRLSPEVEDIWHFSPFIDMNIYRWYQRRFGKPRGDWQMMFFLMIVVLQICYMYLGRALHGYPFFLNAEAQPVDPRLLFYLESPNNWVKLAIVVASIACVAIPIKIWNNTRNELIVEEQRRLLVEARLAALTSQINPHFLFNTLNSISSLVRLNPELARIMIQKLSNILRRLLRRHDAFSTLAEELDFIDDYLDIEVVRFGETKLKIVKEIDEATLEMQVPSMILQPVVENSIKHGLAPRLEGGVVRIRSAVVDRRLVIEVEDNGEGMTEEELAEAANKGIGLGNVEERLRVLYGRDFLLRINSRPGLGTLVQIGVPDVGRTLDAAAPLAARTYSR